MVSIDEIDEIIAHAREVARINRKQYKNCPADRRDSEHQTCEQCAEEHEQLAELLEELKKYKEHEFGVLKKDGQLLYKQGILDGREIDSSFVNMNHGFILVANFTITGFFFSFTIISKSFRINFPRLQTFNLVCILKFY